MRRGLIPVVAALLLLTGCHDLRGDSSSGSDYAETTVRGDTATAAVDPTADDQEARSNVRQAVVAIETWYADHGTYAGLTISAMQELDPLLGNIQLVGPHTRDTYCVESSVGTATYSKQGPAASIMGGFCPDRALAPPPPSSDARANLRQVIPAIEAWNIEHGTYAGLKIARLRAEYDSSIPSGIVIVTASKKNYCVESSAGGETWSYHGPRPGFVNGGC